MSAKNGPPDVLIVGAGIIGCALARELAGRGLRVLVLERGRVGEEASAAAAGLLNPQSDNRVPGPLFELGLASLRLYPEWSGALEEETGFSVAYRRTGLLRCAFDEREEAQLSGFLWQRERGLSIEWWDARALRERLRSRLAPEVRSGVFFPDEGVVDPGLLTRALAAAARCGGVEIREGTAARRFWIEGDRCRGVETERERLPAGCVVDAAGAWAAFDEGLPLAVPVEPVRGQIVELDLGPEEPGTVLHSERAYLVPRGNGRALVGSTLERVGFRKEVTAGAVGDLIREAVRLWPSAPAARFVTAWAGLRPASPDGLPVLGPCGIEGLFFATAHYRHGILLAPVTALLVADRVAGGAAEELGPFALARFTGARAQGSAETPRSEVFR
ncbi:MAG: glycine oxidase ThiO [Thermoanaerobaculia bacterium]